jgi:hypothetical protein
MENIGVYSQLQLLELEFKVNRKRVNLHQFEIKSLANLIRPVRPTRVQGFDFDIHNLYLIIAYRGSLPGVWYWEYYLGILCY